MTTINRRVLLASRPSGWVSEENFTVDEQPVGSPADGQVLCRNLYLSVDPYMRGRMNDVKSYVPPFQIGEPLAGGAVAEVIESRADGFQKGDHVMGMLGWESFSCVDAAGLRKVEAGEHPLSYHLGVLGMPGLTAYVGLMTVGECKEGDSVFVSAASGAVGSVVGQIAKNVGCRVVGSAGSDDKVAWLVDELGFDGAFNYKTVDSVHARMRQAFPKGIDVNFENVGGEIFEAAIWNMAPFGRIALCGMIANYNDRPEETPPGPRGMTALIGRNVKMQGFIVSNYASDAPKWDAMAREWLTAGKLQYRETVAKGIENAPGAFIGMLKGQNFGKQIVKIAE
ncbi:MAG: NADP-dependent oxidoreductase [Pseudomonadota bacterium]